MLSEMSDDPRAINDPPPEGVPYPAANAAEPAEPAEPAELTEFTGLDALPKSCEAVAPATELRAFTGYCLAIIVLVAVASSLHGSWYPFFIDTHYHMAVIQGMEQAGGLPTWAFWEKAPGGRVHIYPPAIHIIGYLVSLVGISPEAFITFLSWFLYPAALLATWFWLRRVFGPRPALVAVVLLAGPQAFFSAQSIFNAAAFALALAPLALLALEKERFLACGVLNLLAATAHPIGLFLPAALGINAVLRRKKMVAGLLAASLPVLIYSPWLAHIWANRVYLAPERTGGNMSVIGFGAGSGLNLGLAMAAAALVGLVGIAVRRRESLSLLGPLLGFAVVWPMGFGGRFLQFNIHWPLASIGGFGVGMLLDRLDRGRPSRRVAVKVASVGLAFLVLSTWVALGVSFARGGPGGPGGRPGRAPRAGRDAGGVSWSVSVDQGTLPMLLQPEGGRVLVRGDTGERQGERQGEASGPARSGRRGGFPGFGGGRRGTFGRPGGPGTFGRPAGAGPAGAAPRGESTLNREGAREFFDAVGRLTAPGDVVYLPDGPIANLLTGVTGRWTSGGILRDVQSAEPDVKPEKCAFFAKVAGGFGGSPGPFGGRGSSQPPDGFEKVFENSFGSLWKNPAAIPPGKPAEAAVPAWALIVLAVVGIAILLLDLLLDGQKRRPRSVIAAAAFLVAVVCVAPLGWTAVGELLHPPEAPAHGNGPAGMPFGGPPPGLGPGGPGASGMPAAPPLPAGTPDDIREDFERLQEEIANLRDSGGDPMTVWSVRDGMNFWRLLGRGNNAEARAVLERALKAAQSSRKPAREPESRSGSVPGAPPAAHPKAEPQTRPRRKARWLLDKPERPAWAGLAPSSSNVGRAAGLERRNRYKQLASSCSEC